MPDETAEIPLRHCGREDGPIVSLPSAGLRTLTWGGPGSNRRAGARETDRQQTRRSSARPGWQPIGRRRAIRRRTDKTVSSQRYSRWRGAADQPSPAPFNLEPCHRVPLPSATALAAQLARPACVSACGFADWLRSPSSWPAGRWSADETVRCGCASSAPPAPLRPAPSAQPKRALCPRRGPFRKRAELLVYLVALLEERLHHRAFLLQDGLDLRMLRVSQVQRARKESHPVPVHAVLMGVHPRRRRRAGRGL